MKYHAYVKLTTPLRRSASSSLARAFRSGPTARPTAAAAAMTTQTRSRAEPAAIVLEVTDSSSQTVKQERQCCNCSPGSHSSLRYVCREFMAEKRRDRRRRDRPPLLRNWSYLRRAPHRLSIRVRPASVRRAGAGGRSMISICSSSLTPLSQSDRLSTSIRLKTGALSGGKELWSIRGCLELVKLDA